jgi:hypothetical protein
MFITNKDVEKYNFEKSNRILTALMELKEFKI